MTESLALRALSPSTSLLLIPRTLLPTLPTTPIAKSLGGLPCPPMFPGRKWWLLFLPLLLFSRSVFAARERASAPRRVVVARGQRKGGVVVVAGVARRGSDFVCTSRERRGGDRQGTVVGFQSAVAHAAATSRGAVIGGCVGAFG